MASSAPAIRVRSAQQYRRQQILFVGLAYAILALIVCVSLYPVAQLVLNSFKSSGEINIHPSGIPREWTLENYRFLFLEQGGLWHNFVNSVIVSVASTASAVFLAALAAFAFAKYRFRGRDLIFALLLATIMVPSEITIPPLYLIFSKIGWLNTYQVQIVPTVISVFGLFMLRQYMLVIPNALLDAARIDGANHWQLFWRVAAPIAAPALGAFAILHFLGIWNSYLWPLIVAPDPAFQPIMVVLPTMVDPHIGFLPIWGPIMAGCVLAVLPIVIIFIAFQDTFISGVVVGAVKE
jgi:ABC-type glycerol-3-phosphate transport system permease component